MLNLGMWDYRKRLEAERRVDELEVDLFEAECRGDFFEEALQQATEQLDEANATIARLHDLVAKFQRGKVSTLYAEGHME